MIKVCEKEWILEVSSISPTLMVDKADETYNFNIFEMLINIKKSNYTPASFIRLGTRDVV